MFSNYLFHPDHVVPTSEFVPTLMEFTDLRVSNDLDIIASNTTEAGIAYAPSYKFEDQPAGSFPGKLTQVLYRRYKAGKKGIVVLSCELIDNNGKELLKCVNQYIDQLNLEDGFKDYVNNDNIFCSTQPKILFAVR